LQVQMVPALALSCSHVLTDENEHGQKNGFERHPKQKQGVRKRVEPDDEFVDYDPANEEDGIEDQKPDGAACLRDLCYRPVRKLSLLPSIILRAKNVLDVLMGNLRDVIVDVAHKCSLRIDRIGAPALCGREYAETPWIPRCW